MAAKVTSAKLSVSRVATRQLGALLIFWAGLSLAHAQNLPVTPTQSVSSPVSAPAKGVTSHTPHAHTTPTATTGSAWNELTPAQQTALAPLKDHWAELSEGRKRKWLAVSQNYPKLSSDEQTKLQSRMTEWVKLSTDERTRARLNYANTKSISPEQKQSKWEEYQSLSPEEKQRLASKASAPVKGAAPALKLPASSQQVQLQAKPRQPSASVPSIMVHVHPIARPVSAPPPATPSTPSASN